MFSSLEYQLFVFLANLQFKSSLHLFYRGYLECGICYAKVSLLFFQETQLFIFLAHL